MSISKYVSSYKEAETYEPLDLSLDSSGVSFISFGLETFNGDSFQVSFDDGLKRSVSSSPISINYNLNTPASDKVSFFLDRENVRSLNLTSSGFSFNVKDLESLCKLKNLTILGNVDFKISDIPNNVTVFSANNAGNVIGGYSDRRRFTYNRMNRFVIDYTSSIGISPSEVDLLLEDLSLAQWEGAKVITIKGNGLFRTSSSDSFVNDLESRGVTVNVLREPTFINVSPESLSFEDDFDNDSNTRQVLITSNGNWSFESTPFWLSVFPSFGNGNDTVTVQVSENDTPNIRTFDLRVNTANDFEIISVLQDREQTQQQ